MTEAISKYTALEVLHVVGPEREEPDERCPSSVRCQDVGSSALPCWLVRAVAGVGGSKLWGPWRNLLTAVEGKRQPTGHGWLLSGRGLHLGIIIAHVSGAITL